MTGCLGHQLRNEGQASLCLGVLGTVSIFPPHGEFLCNRSEFIWGHVSQSPGLSVLLSLLLVWDTLSDTRQVGGIQLVADLWLKTGLSQPSPSEPL